MIANTKHHHTTKESNPMAGGIWTLWITAIAAAIVSFAIAMSVERTGKHQWAHWVVIVLWTLGPPAWFLLDAAFRIQPNGKGALTPQEHFFYDSAGKFWAGVLALLLAVYAKNQWLK